MTCIQSKLIIVDFIVRDTIKILARFVLFHTFELALISQHDIYYAKSTHKYGRPLLYFYEIKTLWKILKMPNTKFVTSSGPRRSRHQNYFSMILLSFEMCRPAWKFVVLNHGYNRGWPWKTASMLIKLRSLPCRLLHALLYVIWLNRDFLYWARINTIYRQPRWFHSQLNDRF